MKFTFRKAVLSLFVIALTFTFALTSTAWAEKFENIFQAAMNGTDEDIMTMLDDGADVNEQDEHGVTVLMYAAKNNKSLEVFKTLLLYGAGVNVQDESGKTALNYAEAGNTPEVAKFLKDAATIFVRTKGVWRSDGKKDAEMIVMDGEGNFALYDSDGVLDSRGYMGYYDEYDDDDDWNGDYHLYDYSGEELMSFHLDSDTQFHVGNDDGHVFVCDDSEE